ncbi:MAG: hypothetical protein ACC628_03650 [Pirellulaceae bacterium]
MHVRDLVDFAAIVATHGTPRARIAKPFPEQGMRQYWSASKCRIDRWSRAIAEYSERGEADSRRRGWRMLRPVFEEILVGEILTRVWTAVVCACDRHCGTDENEPLVMNIWNGHLDARRRVLNVLVSGRGVRMRDAVSLNRLRRRAEKWSDTLLGHLADECSVGRFAFSLRRVRDFARDVRSSSHPDLVWSLLRASFRGAFQHGLSLRSPNGDLNRQIAAAILTSLHTEAFDPTGQFRSVWLMRLERMTDDTCGMVRDLLAAEGPPPLTRYDFPLRRNPLGRLE